MAEAERALTKLVTPEEREQTDRIVTARRQMLTEALADETSTRSPELTALLGRLARAI